MSDDTTADGAAERAVKAREKARSSGPDVAGRLALAIGRINRRMITGGTGLSHGSLSALSSLVKLGPLRLGELAAQEGVAAATMTRIVASLEAKELAVREADPSDRRSFLIEPTLAGTELVLRARSARAELIRRLLDSLEPDQSAAVVAALPALEALVTAEMPPGRGRR